MVAAHEAAWMPVRQTFDPTNRILPYLMPDGAAPLPFDEDGRTVATLCVIAQPTVFHSARTYTDRAPYCDLCNELAVPVIGAAGRYFCLTCRHHLPYKPPAE